MPKVCTPKTSSSAPPKRTVVVPDKQDDQRVTALPLLNALPNGLKEIIIDEDGQWKVKEISSPSKSFRGRRTHWMDFHGGKLEVANAFRTGKVYELLFVRKNQSTTTSYVLKEYYTGRMVKRKTMEGLCFIHPSIVSFLVREMNYRNFLAAAPLNGSLLPVPNVEATTLRVALKKENTFRYFPTNTANSGKPFVYHGTTIPIARCDVVSIHTEGVKNAILINRSGSGWVVDVGRGKAFSTVHVPTKNLKFVRRCGNEVTSMNDGFSYLINNTYLEEEKFPKDQTIVIGDIVYYRLPKQVLSEFRVIEIYGYGENGLLLKKHGTEEEDAFYFAAIKDVKYKCSSKPTSTATSSSSSRPKSPLSGRASMRTTGHKLHNLSRSQYVFVVRDITRRVS